MKKRTITLALIIFSILMFSNSCTNKSEKTEADDKLGKLKIEIPEPLKDKPDVVDYIHNMSRVADDYALLIDQVLQDLGDFHGKDMEELGMMDKIKLMKASAEVGIKSMDMMTKWNDYHEELGLFKDDLNEDELMALEAVMLRFDKRMEQIQKKHEKFFNDKEVE